MDILKKIDIMVESTQDMDSAVQEWIISVQRIIDSYHKKMEYKEFMRPVLSFKKGPKYYKIIKQDIQQSVFAFIDRQNGDILRAAGWAKPAKGARGNLFDRDKGLGRITPYGPEYNK